MNYELYHSRSVRGVINVAFSHFSSQFRQLFRATWQPCLAYVMLQVALAVSVSLLLPWPVLACLLVLMLIANMYVAGCVVRHLSGRHGNPLMIAFSLGWRYLVTVLSCWRRYGFTFAVVLISTLLVALAFCVLGLPQYVLGAAWSSNWVGLAQGDPNGLPVTFPLLTAIVTLVTGFLGVYVDMTRIFCAWYHYGSLKSKER